MASPLRLAVASLALGLLAAPVFAQQAAPAKPFTGRKSRRSSANTS